MIIRKMTSLVISFCLMLLIVSPLSAEVVTIEKESLADFLKTTDEIKAQYIYPSMKISASNSAKNLLEAHTPIMIRCEETITTKNIVDGSHVKFSVVNDVKSKSGLILIKEGTPVSAKISFSKDKGFAGKSGQLTVSDFHTKAVDGTYIPLSGSISTNPDDKMTVSITLSVIICPLFLFMRGKDARLPAGTIKTAYTITNTYIKSISL